ncbi:MAG: RNA 3'-terminal phosphate cyclase [Pirellulales bacterium]|nr:RNA 3'-terminal phosphate cyclase [Pirellulales bacterium]
MANLRKIRIDGSRGEGGGQILRSALALSLITQRPFAVSRIRANRSNPGLAKQHVTAVEAARQLCGGKVNGASLRSQELEFFPGRVSSGDYEFDVGTAGSTTLVLQTVLPPLLACAGSSRVSIRGGTHNPMAPPIEFLQRVFAPRISAMGAELEVELITPGFYPKGGGQIIATIHPPSKWRRIEILQTSLPRVTSAMAVLAKLPRHIAQRELDTLAGQLGLPQVQCHVVEFDNCLSPGNVLYVECTDGRVTELLSVCGQRGVPAEDVAARLGVEVHQYLRGGGPVGPHLADQLLLPMAMGSGGAFDCSELTSHTTTNMEIIRKFVDVGFTVEKRSGGGARVQVSSAKPNS